MVLPLKTRQRWRNDYVDLDTLVLHNQLLYNVIQPNVLKKHDTTKALFNYFDIDPRTGAML
jgi:hypothetical protein